MAGLIATIGGLGEALAVGGTILSGVGAIQSGNAQNAVAQYQARQLEARATAERAAAQRDADKERKQKELVLSRARAVGAASGGGVDLNLLGKIEEEGEYNALMAMWEGEERARGAEDQAAASRWSGKQAKTAGIIGGLTSTMTGLAKIGYDYGQPTILSDGDSFLGKYG